MREQISTLIHKYGLEIPVQYRFIGAKKAVEWAEKNIQNTKVFENIDKKFNKCVK